MTIQKNDHPSSSFLPLEKPSDANRLLQAVWRTDKCAHFLSTRCQQSGRFQNLPAPGIDEAVALAMANASVGDVYFAVAEYLAPERRVTTNVSGACAFWCDIDVGPDKASSGQGYATREEALNALEDFCAETGVPETTCLVNSGVGVHAYWVMDAALKCEQWQAYAGMLKGLMKAHGLHSDPSRTADIASLLRVPGTLNYKYTPPKPVELISSKAAYISLPEMLGAIDLAFASLSIKVETPSAISTPAQVVTRPVVDVAEILPPRIDRLTSALKTLDPDCDEKTWKLRCIAPLAYLASLYPEQNDTLRDLALRWSSGELRGIPSEKWNTPGGRGVSGKQIFNDVWNRFLTENFDGRRVGIRTIYYEAKKTGWTFGGDPAAAAESGDKDKGMSRVPSPTPAVVEGEDASREPSREPLPLLQAYYFLIKLGGKIWVHDRLGCAELERLDTTQKLVFYNRRDASLLMTRTLKKVFPQGEADTVVRSFFTHPDTICYEGLEFNPAGTTAGFLNLWVGPTITPMPGSWRSIQLFLLEVICDDNPEHYDYLVAYIAHALQKPEEKPGVSIILIGGQGIGKGTLGRIFRSIWRATYLHLYKTTNVTGTFNADLERAFIVFLDEALFAGDRVSSDALKSLVTEDVIHINEKHQPSRQIRSYHRFVIATNSEHVKHTDRDDRRDFVLRVSETRKGDFPYWHDLNHEIEGEGLAAMVHDLLAMDLSVFNVRTKPNTGELIEQKLLSLEPIARWWYESLHGRDADTWHTFMKTSSIIEDVVDLAGKRLFRRPSSSEALKAVIRMCPSARKHQQQEYYRRARGLLLPELEVARAEFEAYIGGEVPWE